MNTKTAQKIIELQETLLLDEPYQNLTEEYKMHNTRFIQVLQELPEEQRRIVEDYLGICAELHLKLLELACI